MARLDREKEPYLSHSKVALFERCPLCYYHQYVLGEKESSPAMELGSVFHDAARILYSDGAPPKPRALLELLAREKLEPEQRRKLRNAVSLLCQNRWTGRYKVVSVEQPFFMDLHKDLPPIIGIADLILQEDSRLVVVDHKTSSKFNDLAADQLVLYAEHARRAFGARRIVGCYDEYRLVPDLSTIRKPAFRRTTLAVGKALLAPLVKRYRDVWSQISKLDYDSKPAPGYECWKCKSRW